MNSEILQYLLSNLRFASQRQEGIRACCPFHSEDTPSFFVFYYEKSETFLYKCHGCGVSGHINHLLKTLGSNLTVGQNKNPQFVVGGFERKEQEKKIEGNLHQKQLGCHKVYDYYNSRYISSQVCEKFDFRFDFGPPAAVMPVFFRKRYVGAITRYLHNNIRYEIQPGMDVGSVLFGYDACDQEYPVCVVEGILDAAILWSHDIQTIALIGTKWQQKIQWLERFEKLIFIPDNDLPGLKLSQTLATQLPNLTTHFLPYNTKDIGTAFSDNLGSQLLCKLDTLLV